MYAGQCYQACLDGVYANLLFEKELKQILNIYIKEKCIVNMICKILYFLYSLISINQ